MHRKLMAHAVVVKLDATLPMYNQYNFNWTLLGTRVKDILLLCYQYRKLGKFNAKLIHQRSKFFQ